jgi:hypothetical protein
LGRFIPPQEIVETQMLGKINSAHSHQTFLDLKNLGLKVELLNNRLVEWTKECVFIIVLLIVSLIFFRPSLNTSFSSLHSHPFEPRFALFSVCHRVEATSFLEVSSHHVMKIQESPFQILIQMFSKESF